MINKKMFRFGLMLLLFILNIIFVTSVLFIIKCPVTFWNPLISTLITLFIYIFILKKEKHNLKYITKTIVTFLIIIILSIFISGQIYDTTYDGNTYHKSAIGNLYSGWNPVYEDISEFNNKSDFKLLNNYDIWNNHYAKGYWFYASSIYKITNNIETGKSMYLLTIISTFLIIYSILTIKHKKLFSFIISSLISLNPVTLCQLGTFYNDGLLGNFLILMLISLTLIINKKDLIEKKYNYLLYFITLVLLINIKFTGFAYAGIYSLVYYIYIIFKKNIRQNHLKNITIIATLALIIGVFIIGLSTYPKNLKNNNHPFYPLFGENKVDIMTGNTPSGLDKMNRFKRLFVANFSQTYNSINNGEKLYKLKIPFTLNIKELIYYISPDVRVGGFGVLFSGILLLTVILLIYNFLKIKKSTKDYAYFSIPILTTIFLLIILKDAWWARYIPQFYIFPLIALLIFNNLEIKNKNKKIITLILTGLLILNTALLAAPSLLSLLQQKINIYKEFKEIKNINKHEQILLECSEFSGAAYNIYDKHKNILIVNNIENKETYKKYEFMGSRVNITGYTLLKKGE